MNKLPWPSYYQPPTARLSTRNRVRAENVVREACALTGLSMSDFMDTRIDRSITTARQAVVYVLHKRRPDMSWGQIARRIGRKDHSTAIHAFKRASVRVLDCPEFLRLVLKLEIVQ